jgi:hypothetical protein
MADKPKALAPMTDANRADYGKARAAAYAAAATRLREARQDEYNTYVREEMAERGFEWTPRATGKDRVLEKIRELAAKAGLEVDEVAAALVPSNGGDVTVTSPRDTDE